MRKSKTGIRENQRERGEHYEWKGHSLPGSAQKEERAAGEVSAR